MTTLRWFCAAALSLALAAPAAVAQDGPKPGPEHDYLKKHAGTWDLTMKFGGMDTKGTVVYKMEPGGTWLTSQLESELFGQKFWGKGLDTYDPTKKKYIGIWVDSMSAGPMIGEGTYDKEKKTLTMAGEGPGMDGKPTKYKSVSEMPDDNTINFSMYIGETNVPTFTIVYKRKK